MLDPMPQDKLSPWQDVLRYGEQNFYKPLVDLKRGKKKISHILTLPQKMYVQFNFCSLSPFLRPR